MKKGILFSMAASVAIFAGGDIAPVTPAPMDNWSGFYVGIQGGYLWGDPDIVISRDNDDPDHPDTYHRTHDVSDTDVDGFAGGIYAGYNWLLENDWLIGVEGEWNYVSADGTGDLIDRHSNDPGGKDGTGKTKQEWDASLRLKTGVVVGDYLPYITGGVAWTSVNAKAYYLGINAKAYDPQTLMDDDQILVGWTIGAGVEMAISENVHVRIQYRYTDYGDENFKDMVDADFTEKVDYNSHMLTVGLSYRF